MKISGSTVLVTGANRGLGHAFVCALTDAGCAIEFAPRADAHRNEVVQFRHGAVKWARRLVKRSGAYPWVRRTVGTDRLRRMRSRMTRKVTAEGMEEALGTCGPAQRSQLSAMHRASQAAVASRLRAQDARLGLDWATVWERSCPSGEPPALAALSDGS